MFPVVLKWPITIYTYGLMISAGVLVSLYILTRLGEKNGVNSDQIMELIIWVLITGFIGARILYIIVEWKMFLASPARTVLSRSGFVFYGGVITGIPVLVWRIKKLKLNLWKTLDMFSVVVPLAHAFGRVGCFAFGCCYGRETSSWIGMKFPAGSPAGVSGHPVIPTQLIEAALLVVLFGFLLLLYYRKKTDGVISVTYLIAYGIIRFFVEFFRNDDRGSIGIFSTSQFMSILIVVSAIFTYYIIKSKRKL